MLGEVIHGYRIDRALSEDKGGFGDVYFATHVDSGAEAVVKVLKPEMSARRDIVARFFNEARAAASIHHPGIVQIHNVGYHGDRAYLLMERLRGHDLEARLQAGPLPLDRAILFVRQTAGAIGAAHERGIVHRDLKPANLFVVEDPDVIGGERVKVLDFGIAKLTVDAGGGKTQGVFGTPAYMSPEQCASTAAVDARSDLYSLGCIFYELVSGRPPFGHGGLGLIAAHLRDTPLPPSAMASGLPPAIEQVILQLLEKQPERRFPSCGALVAALDAAAAVSGIAITNSPHVAAAGSGTSPSSRSGTPTIPDRHPPAGPSTVTAPELGAVDPAARWMPPKPRRKRWLWIGAAIAVVATGAIVFAVGMTGPAEPPEVTAVRPAAVDAGSAAIALADAAVAVASTADASIESLPPPSSVIAKTPAPKPASRAKAKLVADASDLQVASRLNEEGKDAVYREDYPRAIERFQQAIAHVPKATYFFNLCTALVQANRLDEALNACKAVNLHDPTADQRTKAGSLIGVIRSEAKKRNLELRERP